MTVTADAPLMTIDEARALAGNRPGRNVSYEEVRQHGTFLGVPVVRCGRRVFVARAALERVLAGASPARPGEVNDGRH